MCSDEIQFNSLFVVTQVRVGKGGGVDIDGGAKGREEEK